MSSMLIVDYTHSRRVGVSLETVTQHYELLLPILAYWKINISSNKVVVDSGTYVAADIFKRDVNFSSSDTLFKTRLIPASKYIGRSCVHTSRTALRSNA